MVYAIGLRENAILDERKVVDMCDMIHSLHDRKKGMEKVLERKLNNKELTKMHVYARAQTNVQPGLWGHYWHYARYDGECWELFSKILLGQTGHKKTTRPKALTMFVHTRSLATAVLIPYFRKVVEGTMTLADMSNQFKLIKCMNLVRVQVVEFLKGNGFNVAVHEEKKDSYNWEALCKDKRYPASLLNPELISNFGEIGSRAKITPSNPIIPGLQDKLRELFNLHNQQVQSLP